MEQIIKDFINWANTQSNWIIIPESMAIDYVKFLEYKGKKVVNKNDLLPDVSDSLLSDIDINEKAWKHYNMKTPVNTEGLKFKMYCEFVNGAKWLRDLPKSNER